MKIYGDQRSGNCLKVKYVADYLSIAYQWQDVDIMAGETQAPAFLALNPQGQVPVLELETGRGSLNRMQSSDTLPKEAGGYPSNRLGRHESMNGCSGSNTAMNLTSRYVVFTWSMRAGG